MCFYPQEDTRQLEFYRGQLTPFSKSVMKALKFELENDDIYCIQKQESKATICEDIIREAISLTNSTQFGSSLPTSSTLAKELDLLALNMK